MPQVYPAEPYKSGALCSLGRADHMLLCQYKFPDTFRDSESLVSLYSDRVDSDRFHVLLRKHTGDHGDIHVENWFRSATHSRHIEFLKDLLEVNQETTWTGYRVTASVAGNGHTIWFFELFARRPESDTAIYSNERAPNVLLKPRH